MDTSNYKSAKEILIIQVERLNPVLGVPVNQSGINDFSKKTFEDIIAAMMGALGLMNQETGRQHNELFQDLQSRLSKMMKIIVKSQNFAVDADVLDKAFSEIRDLMQENGLLA